MDPVFDTKAMRKIGDLGNPRDILKFLAKRNLCSCLKEMHSRARKDYPKLGQCGYCQQEKERKTIMVCSRCQLVPYCGRSCQVAHWPSHKDTCADAVASQRQQRYHDLQMLAGMINASWDARDTEMCVADYA